ncbi:6352_t:CDS:2 [Funneliformis geosporum]|uniref:18069_t:CDS:1 n=1 Tax=Funneliformis geosporum TaxID=1117311 RepID=A0A9W4SCU9_9GLOM|nr:18069_t:CDS:2 [Funneliformis geosporum]CAI2166538.1 6352_t:CDS:2 [Funneliformis geosporum]
MTLIKKRKFGKNDYTNKRHHINNNRNDKRKFINSRKRQIYNYKIHSKKDEGNAKTVKIKITKKNVRDPILFKDPFSSYTSSYSNDQISYLKGETKLILNSPVICGITGVSLVVVVVLILIIRKTKFCKHLSSSFVKNTPQHRHLLNVGKESTNHDDDKPVPVIVSNYKSEDDDEITKLPPVARFSSSRRRKSRPSIPNFNYSPQNSIRMSNCSRYDFLKSKINYLDQDFNNYFRPVHSLFERDLIEEIDETIKDDFVFNSLPAEAVNWEECMR